MASLLPISLGASVVFLNVWLAKYVKPPQGDVFFIGIFESASYLILMLIFRFVLVGISKNVTIAIHPVTLFRKMGFWPIICVLSAFAYKFIAVSSLKSNFLQEALAQLAVIGVDGLIVLSIPRFFGPKPVGSTDLRDYLLRISVATVTSFTLASVLKIKTLLLLFHMIQYMALDKELHLINSNIAEVIIANYGLSTLLSLGYLPFLDTVPSAEMVAFLVYGILWKWIGLLSLFGLLYTGMVRGMSIFVGVRLLARYLVYGSLEL